ncbi:hypothetical protein FQR65_LT02121 [Abscondita terminalis]|nr:hypothetical protein FQR65_LT02121 [Abscondita terminalis]
MTEYFNNSEIDGNVTGSVNISRYIKIPRCINKKQSLLKINLGGDKSSRIISIENNNTTSCNSGSTKELRQKLTNLVYPSVRGPCYGSLCKDHDEMVNYCIDDYVIYKNKMENKLQNVLPNNVVTESSTKPLHHLFLDFTNAVRKMLTYNVNDSGKDTSKNVREVISTNMTNIKNSVHKWGESKLTEKLCQFNNRLNNENEKDNSKESKTLHEALEETATICKEKLEDAVEDAKDALNDTVSSTNDWKDGACEAAVKKYEASKQYFDEHSKDAWEKIVKLADYVDIRGKVGYVKGEAEKIVQQLKRKTGVSNDGPDNNCKKEINEPPPNVKSRQDLSDAITEAAQDLQIKFDEVKEEVKNHLYDTKKMLNTVFKGIHDEPKHFVPPTKRDKIFRGFEQAKYLTHQSLTYNKEEIRSVFDYIIKQTKILCSDRKITKDLQMSLEKELESVYNRAERYIRDAQIKINESLCLLQQQSINALIDIDMVLKNASEQFDKIKHFGARSSEYSKISEPDINAIHKISRKIKKEKIKLEDTQYNGQLKQEVFQ